jgi:hypothetical protein
MTGFCRMGWRRPWRAGAAPRAVHNRFFAAVGALGQGLTGFVEAEGAGVFFGIMEAFGHEGAKVRHALNSSASVQRERARYWLARLGERALSMT